MPRDGSATRERIMNAGRALILEQGYAGTSVDSLIARAGVTKGTFFHHFPTKQKLADALVRRWATDDIRHIDNNLSRARTLAREPLQQLLVFIGLFEEMFEGASMEQAGCLYASFVYEAELFDTGTLQFIRNAFEAWRERLVPLFEEVVDANPPRRPVDARELIDLMSVVFEGAFVVSRVYRDPGLTRTHLQHYRNYIELLFIR